MTPTMVVLHFITDLNILENICIPTNLNAVTTVFDNIKHNGKEPRCNTTIEHCIIFYN